MGFSDCMANLKITFLWKKPCEKKFSIYSSSIYYAPPRGRGVADRQRGGCISIFEQVLPVNFATTFTAETTVIIVITATIVRSELRK